MLLDEIRKARRSKGLTQREIAEGLGVNVKAVARLENGVGTMPLLIRVMDALQYRVAGLAAGRSFTEQLITRRKNLGWTMVQAAERAAISRTTLASIERGEASVAALMKYWAIVGQNARAREPERIHWNIAQAQDKDARFTPPSLMAHIYDAFGSIDLDPCGHPDSPVVTKRRICLQDGGDGLAEPWGAGTVWMNPPFSAMLKWLRKADEEWSAGRAKTIVCLVPARSESAYFHDRLIQIADILLIRGRIRFLTKQGPLPGAPFPLMLVVFGGQEGQIERLSELVDGQWLTRTKEAA
ncbi:hypothetical protein BRX37_23945 [Sphingomonas sp. S-NIH.Pt3_0716]|nr:hypothetical protein BRX37_23945 [Sphingomonas sp. S-NIH.Pt3_0716]